MENKTKYYLQGIWISFFVIYNVEKIRINFGSLFFYLKINEKVKTIWFKTMYLKNENLIVISNFLIPFKTKHNFINEFLFVSELCTSSFYNDILTSVRKLSLYLRKEGHKFLRESFIPPVISYELYLTWFYFTFDKERTKTIAFFTDLTFTF